jgi:hypothetical protein
MKLVPILVCAAVVSATLAGCDSTGPKTVTRTVVDTIYTDRFAQDKAVVWGEWALSLKSKSDSGNVVFLQDSSHVTAYIFWQRNPQESILAGSITNQTMRLSQDSMILSSRFVDSAGGKETKMIGLLVNTGSTLASDSFTAVRTE